MSDVEVSESLEWVSAGDIRVEHKERRVVLGQDVSCQCERSGGAEWLSLDRKVDGNTVLLLGLLEHGDHDFGSVVDGEDDILDASLDESFDLVKDHRFVAELDQRLGEGERQGTESSAEAWFGRGGRWNWMLG